MVFKAMVADIDENVGDIIGSIFGWYEKQKSANLIRRDIYPFINGARINGFDFLNRLRKESETKGLRMIAVKNCEYIVSPFSVKEQPRMCDIVRKYKDGSVGYWFELSIENRRLVVDRLDELMIEVMALARVEIDESLIDENDDVVIDVDKKKSYLMVPVTLWFPCTGEIKKMRSKILSAENIKIDGMEINVSPAGSYVQQKHIVVLRWSPIEIDLGVADNVLKKIKSWKELSPLVNSKEEPLFSDSINAVLLANAFFTKKSVPAFNLLVIGSKRNQKTAAISFLTQYMMGGSVVSGTASSGKGWLVSHKEKAEPSKLFSEKNALMIDEALKFHGGDGETGIKVRLKNHFGNHMEIIEHKEIEAQSGNGIIRGTMSCSLVCVDNPDEYTIPALGGAYMMQSAQFRRWNFLHMERRKDVELPYLTTQQAYNMMIKKFIARFGSMESVRSLLLLSRRLCEAEHRNADQVWVDDLRRRLKSEVDTPSLFPYLSDVLTKFEVNKGDENDKKLFEQLKFEIKEHIDDDFTEMIQASWLSAAAMRGWEVCNSVSKFKLIYDDAQKMLAETIVRELFKGRLDILFPGIVEWYVSHQGVKRINIFGGDRTRKSEEIK